MSRDFVSPCVLLLAALLFLPLSASGQATVAGVSAGQWETIVPNSLPTERHENAMAEVNGKFVLVGGRGIKKAFSYDPTTNWWTGGANPPFQMHHFQAVVYNDLIYIVGAYTGACCDSESGVSHVYTYDPASDQWTQRHEIPANRRRGSTGAVLYNDKIYIVGGIDGGHGNPATAYKWFDEYDPETGDWTVLPDAPRVRDHFNAVVHNGKMYLIGGRDSSDPSIVGDTKAQIDYYNFNTGQWSTLPSADNLPTPRGGTMSILYNGEILVIGGETQGQTLAHKETEAFNPATGEWRTVGDLNIGRHATGVVLYDNALYVAAGSSQKGGEPELNSMEKYEDDETQLVTLQQHLQPGWNLVGLPLQTAETHYLNLYTDVLMEVGIPPLRWGGTAYEAVNDLTANEAFWLKITDDAPDPQIQGLTGTTQSVTQISLVEGWNMISGPSCDNIIVRGVSTDPVAAIPTGNLYYFDNGYQKAFSNNYPRGVIDQGIGYWVRSEESAVLTLNCESSKGITTAGNALLNDESSPDISAFGALTIQDAAANTGTYYLGASFDDPKAVNSFLVPPRPPREYFDVRFAQDSRLVEADQGTLNFQGVHFPATLTWHHPAGYGLELIALTRTGQTVRSATLQSGESLTLSDAGITQLELTQLTHDAQPEPTELAIQSIFPNPASERANIVFNIPFEADLSFTVYDVLGREVFNQVAGPADIGHAQEHTLALPNLPAGMYVIRMTASHEAGSTAATSTLMITN